MSTARAEKRPKQMALGRKVVPAQLRLSSAVRARIGGVWKVKEKKEQALGY
jgi:hypothetical protein